MRNYPNIRNGYLRKSELSSIIKQDLYSLSDTHILDKSGYHGNQYEKSVYNSDGTGKIVSSGITNQTIVESYGTATLTLISGEIQIGNGWVSNIKLSDGTLYLCEERIGTIVYDCSGNSNHGALIGGITHMTIRDASLMNYTNEHGYTNLGGLIVPRIINSDLDAQGSDCQFIGKVASDMKMLQSNCLNFNGLNGYIVTNLANPTLTRVKFWFKTSTSTGITHIISGFNNRKAIGTQNGHLVFKGSTSGVIKSVISVSDNVWRYYDIDLVNNTLYIDGELQATTTGTLWSALSSNLWICGRESQGVARNLTEGHLAGIELYDELGEVIQFDLAEGSGTTVYQRNNEDIYGNVYGGVIWDTQDVFHANINKGFSDIGDGVKRPYKVNGEYTNPSARGHNGAETLLKMEVFREGLYNSELHYDQSTLDSNLISYDDIISNFDNTTFATIKVNSKVNILTLLPKSDKNGFLNYKNYQYGFHKGFNTFRTNINKP